MKLIQNISRFETHFTNAKKLRDKDISDYFVYNTLAMECFQAVNALIEIGEFVITCKKLGFPSTYREIFEILAHNQWMREDELEASKRLVFLRNLIAHEYYRISKDELLEMIGHLEKINNFVNRIKKEKEK